MPNKTLQNPDQETSDRPLKGIVFPERAYEIASHLTSSTPRMPIQENKDYSGPRRQCNTRATKIQKRQTPNACSYKRKTKERQKRIFLPFSYLYSISKLKASQIIAAHLSQTSLLTISSLYYPPSSINAFLTKGMSWVFAHRCPALPSLSFLIASPGRQDSLHESSPPFCAPLMPPLPIGPFSFGAAPLVWGSGLVDGRTL